MSPAAARRSGARARAVFVARFLGLFAVLACAGFAVDAPAHYAGALRLAGTVTSPLLNGWSLEQRDSPSGRQEIWFRRGNDQLRLALGLHAMALSLLPLLALLGATPGLGAAGLAARAAIGVAALLALDLLVVLLY
ncbi:MAG: hypothetical protein ABI629_22405, partial [bacterium]